MVEKINIAEILKDYKVDNIEIVEAVKLLLKKEELSEEEAERAEYVIKKLGISDSSSKAEIEYLSGFDIELESGDKEVIERTKEVLSFKEKVIKGWGIEEVKSYVEFFGYKDLKSLSNIQIDKLSKVKSLLGNAAENPAKEKFKEIDKITAVNIEAYGDIVAIFNIKLASITNGQFKKMELLLESLGVQDICRITEDSIEMAKIIKTETGLDITKDSKLEVKEKLWQVEGLGLKSSGSEKTKAVISFFRSQGKKIMDIGDNSGEIIEELGVKNEESSSLSKNNLKVLDINIDSLFKNYSKYKETIELIKKISGKSLGELPVQEMHHLNEISEVFTGNKVKMLDEEEREGLVKVISKIDLKLSDWINGRAFGVKQGVQKYGISINSSEAELKKFANDLTNAELRLCDFNEGKAKQLKDLKEELGSVEVARQIKQGLGHRDVFELTSLDIEKIKELNKLSGGLELKNTKGEIFEKMGVLLGEFNIVVRSTSLEDIKKLVTIVKLISDKKAAGWFTSQAKEVLDCEMSDVKNEARSIKEKIQVLGFKKIMEISEQELKSLQMIFKINAQVSLNKQEAESLRESYEIIGENDYWGYIRPYKLEEILDRIKGISVDVFHLKGELDYLRKVKDIFEDDGKMDSYKEVLRLVTKKGSESNHKLAVRLTKEIWGDTYRLDRTDLQQIKSLVKAEKAHDERQQELVLEVLRECKFSDEINPAQERKMAEVSIWVTKWGECKDAMITVGSSCDEYAKYDHYLQEDQIKGICNAGGTEDL